MQYYEDKDMIALEREDGDKEVCEILGIYRAGENEYIALNRIGTQDILIYRYTETQDGFNLGDDMSEEEFKTAVEAFERNLERPSIQ